MPSTLGEKIHKQRKKLNLTLDDLALKIGSTKSYIWELENKPTVRPSAEKIFKLADALQVSSEFLIDDSKNEPTQLDRDGAFFRKFESLDNADKEVIENLIKFFDGRHSDKT